MKFLDLLDVVEGEAVFESGLLLAGDVDPADVRRQLVRWVRAGRILQFRRGLYALAAPYAKATPHPFLVANRLVPGSYVSLHSALAHHGLIPEHVPVTTSVTAGRPGRWQTPLGAFEFRHVKPALLWGSDRVDLPGGQRALVAGPEKALLDLVHLEAGASDRKWLAGLRLGNLDGVDLAQLAGLAARTGSPKLARAARRVTALAEAERQEYRAL